MRQFPRWQSRSQAAMVVHKSHGRAERYQAMWQSTETNTSEIIGNLENVYNEIF